MITIDGSEGGGQILRTSIAFSEITKQPCKIINIRKARPNPGLQEQHLQGITAIAELCGGKLHGAIKGATEVQFFPGEDNKQELVIDINTAGSIGLVIQSLLLPCLLSEDSITVKINGGATAGKWAPPIEWIEKILFEKIKLLDAKAYIEVKKHGFYPKGGAEVVFKTQPMKKMECFDFTEFFEPTKLFTISTASDDLRKANVAERQASGNQIMQEVNNLVKESKSKIEYVNSICTGSSILTYTDTLLSGDALGEIKKKAEQVGDEAAGKLLEEIRNKASIDMHLADNLIPFMAICDSKCMFKTSDITDHIKTNISVVEKFTDVKFEINNNIISSRKR